MKHLNLKRIYRRLHPVQKFLYHERPVYNKRLKRPIRRPKHVTPTW